MSASAASMRAAIASVAARAFSAAPVALRAAAPSRSERMRASPASRLAVTRSCGAAAGSPAPAAHAPAPPARRKGMRSRRRMRLPFAMIGVVRKDRCRAEELLGEHGPRQEVRPGRLAEGEEQVGPCPLRLPEAVRATNEEAGLAPAVVAPAFEPPCQFEARQLLALFIK